MKVGKSATDTQSMIRQVYSGAAMSRAESPDRHTRFARGKILLEGDERSGRLSTRSTPKMLKSFGNLRMGALCIKNLHSWARQSKACSTARFYAVLGKTIGESDQMCCARSSSKVLIIPCKFVILFAFLEMR